MNENSNNIPAINFLDELLSVSPGDTCALFLKMEIHDQIFQEHEDYGHFLKAIDTSLKVLEITENKSQAVMDIRQKCRCCTVVEDEIIDKALEIEPDNEYLLYRKALNLTNLFEEDNGDPDSLSELVSVVKRMKEFYPESMLTKNIINDSYDAMPAESRRYYRHALEMPELHEDNVISFKQMVIKDAEN